MIKNIALLVGGYSGEALVSKRSAQTIIDNIDPNLFRVYAIFIDQKNWIYTDLSGQNINVDKNDFSIVEDNKKITFDAAFIMIHGTPGEDGKLQGYFDLLNIPYTTCSLTTSALTFNKHFSKVMAQSFGVKSAKSCFFTANDKIDKNEVINALGFPMFIKANKSGSSIGITKAENENDFEVGINDALKADNEILIEENIKGREITCGIARLSGELFVFPVTEIIPKENVKYFDYKAKYNDGAWEVTPAQIPDDIYKQCQDTSLMLYDKLCCGGVVRFDYIYSNNELYFLEVNTVPGMSDKSIIPQQAKHYGIELQLLITKLINNAFNKK